MIADLNTLQNEIIVFLDKLNVSQESSTDLKQEKLYNIKITSLTDI